MPDTISLPSRLIYLEDLATTPTPGTQDTNVPVAGYGPATLTRIYFGSTFPVINETPSGVIDTNNVTFTLAYSPVSNTLALYYNGVRQHSGVDYTLAGNTITFSSPPVTGSWLVADYQH